MRSRDLAPCSLFGGVRRLSRRHHSALITVLTTSGPVMNVCEVRSTLTMKFALRLGRPSMGSVLLWWLS